MLKIKFNPNIDPAMLDDIIAIINFQFNCMVYNVDGLTYNLKCNPSPALMNFIQQLHSTYHIVEYSGGIKRK